MAFRTRQTPQLECSDDNGRRTFLDPSDAPLGAATRDGVDWPADAHLIPHDDIPHPESLEVTPIPVDSFHYIGEGLTGPQFTDYVKSFDFGDVAPEYVVIHHTANPGTVHAGYTGSSPAVWDSNEENLTDAQIKEKRSKQLVRIRDSYRVSKGWTRGPHLFIDDRYIWLFTPMNMVGAHALDGGNSYFDQQLGRTRRSIGIEVLGDYTHKTWPEPIARLVGHAVATLKRQLKTFELEHRERAGWVSFHRDYNKPACPGNALSADFIMSALQDGLDRIEDPDRPLGQATATPLRRGDKGPRVTDLQEDLVALGHMTLEQMLTGPGVFGPRTEAALEAFQSENHLAVTRVVDAETETAREALRAGVKRGMNSGLVRALQERLVRLGLMTLSQIGQNWGQFGPRTEAALIRFQSTNGLPPRGVLDFASYARVRAASSMK